MIGPAMDRGGLKDSENAPNSIFPKINESPFWRFGTDMDGVYFIHKAQSKNAFSSKPSSWMCIIFLMTSKWALQKFLAFHSSEYFTYPTANLA